MARSQLDAAFAELRSGVYGNPHSGGSPSSAASLDKVGTAGVRLQVLGSGDRIVGFWHTARRGLPFTGRLAGQVEGEGGAA